MSFLCAVAVPRPPRSDRTVLRRVSAAGLVLCAALVPPLAALDPERSLSQYQHGSWRVADGLPQSSVQAIARTPDGYLWLGTRGGLARFDGFDFQTFDRLDTEALRLDDIWSLAVDGAGDLWIAVNGGGLVRRTGEGFERFGLEEGLPSLRVTRLEASADGGVWVGTYGGGLVRFRDGRVQPVPEAAELSNAAISALAEAPDGALHVGTRGGGLYALAEGELTPSPAAGLLGGSPVWSILPSREGPLWVGTDRGLHRIEGAAVTSFSEADGLAHRSVLSLLEDRDGALWIGTYGGGLQRLRDGGFETMGSGAGLGSDHVPALFEDPSGSLWIGTWSGGLDRLRDPLFTVLSSEQGVSGDVVLSLDEAADGTLWIGAHEGLFHRLRDGEIREVPLPRGARGTAVWAVLAGSGGALWVGTEGAGLLRRDGGTWQTWTAADGLAHDVVFCLLEDGDGSLWIGTDGGLSRLRDGEIRTWTSGDGLAGDQVRELWQDDEGVLWVGTTRGLSLLEGSEITTLTSEDGLPNDRVWSIASTGDGTVWVGTHGGGLARIRDGRIRAVTRREGLPDDKVTDLVADGRGGLWMCSARGIFRLSLARLETLPTASGLETTERLTEGVPGYRETECWGGTQPTGLRTADGTLWFASVQGAVSVRPDEVGGPAEPPRPRIERILAAGRSVPLQDPVRLETGERDVTLEYTAIHLERPEAVRFRHRLRNVAPGWVETRSRRARFAQLEAGTYTFEVGAGLVGGRWARTSQAVTLVVPPYWYETRWFLGLLGLIAGGAVYGVYRLRVRQLRDRERRLEARVEESLSRIRVLRGLIPICSWCKKIRDDEGFWSQMEVFIREHSEAEFSHGLCPDCERELYGDLETEEP